MAYEHVQHRIRSPQRRYLHPHVSRKKIPDNDPGFEAVYLDREGCATLSHRTTWRLGCEEVGLLVLGTDPKDVRGVLDDLLEQVRENFVIEAMDLLGCGTDDLTVFEFWRRTRGRWLGHNGNSLIQTTAPLYTQYILVTLVAVRKADGPFETGGFSPLGR